MYSDLMVKTEFMNIRLPEDLKDRIRKQAEKNRRTLANELLVLVERGMEFSKAK